MKFLVLLAIATVAAAGRNVPVSGPYGRTVYVDPEEVLQDALQGALWPLGVFEVEVDSHWFRSNEFYVDLFTHRNLGPDFLSRFQQVIHSNLGLSDVTVSALGSGHLKQRFYLTFNRATMPQRFQSLFSSAMASPHSSLEVEHSPYD